MGILTTELYSKMVSNGPLKLLGQYKITTIGGDLDWEYHLCQVYATTSSTKYKYIDKNEIKAIIAASYLAYIPYGSMGYKKAKKILKENNYSLSLEEFRFEKFKKIMGYNLNNFSTEQIKYLKDFFLNFEKEILNLSDIRDVSILYCRLHNEIEANYINSDKYNVKEIKREMSLNVANDIKDNDLKVIEINKYLLQIKKPEKLDEKQIEHIKSFLRY